MYNAKVIDVFIASPSDVNEERDIAEQVIQQWNANHSKKNKIILRPLRWEKNVHSDFSKSPQDVVNEQLLTEADILIAIFWSKIGTPTENYESGTVEELKTHINDNKPAMVLFSKADLKQDHDQQQYNKLMVFKSWCQSHGIYFEFDKIEFKELVRNQLELLLNSNKFQAPETLQEDLETIIPPKQSRIKSDAIDLINTIPEYQKTRKGLSEFIDNLGSYRRKKLKYFLEESDLLMINETSSSPVLAFKTNLNNLRKEDIDLILEDIENGEYDHCF